jgi:hypothetical protein
MGSNDLVCSQNHFMRASYCRRLTTLVGLKPVISLIFKLSKHLSAVIAVCCLVAVLLACNMRSDADWQKQLGDKKLSKASNSGSISNKVDIYFCPSGEYGMVTQFSGLSGGGAGTLSMADENTEYGRWTVTSSTLILQSQNGERHAYDISQVLMTVSSN